MELLLIIMFYLIQQEKVLVPEKVLKKVKIEKPLKKIILPKRMLIYQKIIMAQIK